MENKVKYGRIAVKVGSSTLTHRETGRLNIQRMESLVRTLSDIRNSGCEIVLVSSGAVAAGAACLRISHRDRSLAEKQALAAVGQPELMRMYERLFSGYGHSIGQILMTRDIVDIPTRAEHLKNTFSKLFELSCIPIVNENDSISDDELKFGDNDTLSAYVAIACKAELLVNFTDTDGLYDSDPRSNPDARLIETVTDLLAVSGCAGKEGSKVGTGGMVTKLRAAAIATEGGIPMIITNGKDPSSLYAIMEGERRGTYFAVKKEKENGNV